MSGHRSKEHPFWVIFLALNGAVFRGPCEVSNRNTIRFGLLSLPAEAMRRQGGGIIPIVIGMIPYEKVVK